MRCCDNSLCANGARRDLEDLSDGRRARVERLSKMRVGLNC